MLEFIQENIQLITIIAIALFGILFIICVIGKFVRAAIGLAILAVLIPVLFTVFWGMERSMYMSSRPSLRSRTSRTLRNSTGRSKRKTPSRRWSIMRRFQKGQRTSLGPSQRKRMNCWEAGSEIALPLSTCPAPSQASRIAAHARAIAG